MSEPRYRWQGIDRQGRNVHGRQSAPSRADLRTQLEAQRIRVTRIHRALAWQRLGAGFGRSPRTVDITHVCRHLGILLKAGMPLLEACQMLQRSATSWRLRRLLGDVHQRLAHGQTLSQALAAHDAFDAMACHLVRAGELSGTLDTMLARLTQHRESTQALQQAVRSALLYPGMVLLVAGLVWMVLLTWVVPMFAEIYAALDAELPALTQQVLTLSRIWHTHGGIALGLVVALCFGTRQLLRRHTPSRAAWHRGLLRLPLIGTVARQVCITRWCRALATLLAAGVPITDALQAVAGVTGNLQFEKATQSLHRQLMNGKSLTQALGPFEPLFSVLLLQMCSVGETSGTLDLMLEKMAELCERNLDLAVSRLTTLLEPAMLLVLGVMLGGMVFALYGPLFQLGQVL